MSGTWPTARAVIVTHLDHLAVDAGAEYAAETLTALAFPPASVQTSIVPYCYVVPPARRIERWPGSHREMTFTGVRVRFILGGLGDNLERIATRMEAVIEAIADAFDDAVSLDGTVDVVLSQEISELQVQQPEEMWGFDMLIELSLSEQKTFSA